MSANDGEGRDMVSLLRWEQWRDAVTVAGARSRRVVNAVAVAMLVVGYGLVGTLIVRGDLTGHAAINWLCWTAAIVAAVAVVLGYLVERILLARIVREVRDALGDVLRDASREMVARLLTAGIAQGGGRVLQAVVRGDQVIVVRQSVVTTGGPSGSHASDGAWGGGDFGGGDGGGGGGDGGGC